MKDEMMKRFHKNDIQELKEFLYNSCVHDARLDSIEYHCGKGSLSIQLFHLTFNTEICLTVQGIEIALAIKGKRYGSSETVISLTVEEDFSYLQTYLPQCNEYMGESLYLLLQMFSGDEMHIVSKEVAVEIITM